MGCTCQVDGREAGVAIVPGSSDVDGGQATRSLDLKWIKVSTSDGVTLDGALYEPNLNSAKPAFLIVHGIRWNYRSGPSRWMAPNLAELGYPCLSLNLRDHDSEAPKGLVGAVEDLDAGTRFLLAGGREVVILAHGYGCVKAIAHAGQRGTRSSRRALTTLGAVARTHPTIWSEALARSAEMAGSTLVVQGAVDHLVDAQVRAEELRCAAPMTVLEFELLEGGNHYFEGQESALIERLVGWEVATRPMQGAA